MTHRYTRERSSILLADVDATTPSGSLPFVGFHELVKRSAGISVAVLVASSNLARRHVVSKRSQPDTNRLGRYVPPLHCRISGL